MSKKRRKRPMTLVEIMIVIFIIGMISSVVGVNMRKSLEKGKHFKTKQAITKLYNVMEMAVAEDPNLFDEAYSDQDKQEKVSKTIKASHFVRKSSKPLLDGWGKPFDIVIEGDQVQFISKAYEDYCTKQKLNIDYPWNEEEEEA